MENNNLKETGLIILTFASLNLPETLMIGYERVNIRPYIPLPLRCRNCLRLGHPTSTCKSTKLCNNCSAEQHTIENEPCIKDKFCINCKYDVNKQNNHSPTDKSCPAFIKQKEITAIIILEKVDHKTATSIYFSRNLHHDSKFSTIAAAQPNHQTATTYKPTNKSTTLSSNTSNTNQQQRTITTYQDLETEMDTLDFPTTSKTISSTKEGLSEELKLRLYGSKQATLTKPLKCKEKNESKPKKNNRNKNTILNSDSESI